MVSSLPCWEGSPGSSWRRSNHFHASCSKGPRARLGVLRRRLACLHTAVYPDDGALNVSKNTHPTATFDQELDQATFNNNNFKHKVRQANHDEDYAEPYQDLAEYPHAALMLNN
jgi:hypothetical protein